MPSCASYVITECDNTDIVKKWSACVRADISNSDQAHEWLSEFEFLNNLDFRVRKAKKENSDRLVFKVISDATVLFCFVYMSLCLSVSLSLSYCTFFNTSSKLIFISETVSMPS